MIVGQHIQWNTLCDIPYLHGILNNKLDNFIKATDPNYGKGELLYYYQVDYANQDIIISVYQYVDGLFLRVSGCGYNNNKTEKICVTTPTPQQLVPCETPNPCVTQQPTYCQPQNTPFPQVTNDHTKLINQNADANLLI